MRNCHSTLFDVDLQLCSLIFIMWSDKNTRCYHLIWFLLGGGSMFTKFLATCTVLQPLQLLTSRVLLYYKILFSRTLLGFFFHTNFFFTLLFWKQHAFKFRFIYIIYTLYSSIFQWLFIGVYLYPSL